MSRLTFIPQHLVDMPQMGTSRVALDAAQPSLVGAANSQGLFNAEFPNFENGGLSVSAVQSMGTVYYDFTIAYDDEEFWGVDSAVTGEAGLPYLVRAKLNSDGRMVELGRYYPGAAAAVVVGTIWNGPGSVPAVMRLSKTQFVTLTIMWDSGGAASYNAMSTYTWNGSSFSYTTAVSTGIAVGNTLGVSGAALGFLNVGDGGTSNFEYAVVPNATTFPSMNWGGTVSGRNSRTTYRIDATRVIIACNPSNFQTTLAVASFNGTTWSLGAGVNTLDTIVAPPNAEYHLCVLNPNRIVFYDKTNGWLQVYGLSGNTLSSLTINSLSPFFSPRVRYMGRINDNELVFVWNNNDGTFDFARRAILNADDSLTLLAPVQLNGPAGINPDAIQPDNRGLTLPANRILLTHRAVTSKEQLVRVLKAA